MSARFLIGLLAVAWLPLLPVRASGQVVFNEILARNHLTDLDEDGDSSDWLELLNRGDSEADLGGHGLTDDPRLPRKWVFPSIKVPPHGYLRVWLSGKDRYVPPPQVIAGDPGGFAFRASIIAAREEWQYLVADPLGQGPPVGWNRLGFDTAAAGFLPGASGFGYSDEDDDTVLPAGTTAVFIRKVFHVEDPAQLRNLVLRVNFDDGFVAYLNGTRVASELAPTGDPNFQSLATGSHEQGTPLSYDLTPWMNKMAPGDNVLALVGLNVSATSSDLSLSPELGVIPLVLHANFELNGDGEYLALTDPTGRPLDEVPIPPQTEDHSYGRFPDGSGAWAFLLTPTPEGPNLTLSSPTPFSSKVAFDPPPGRYKTAVTVAITVDPADISAIHYTIDGSAPTLASPISIDPLRITSSTVVRAAAFIGEERSTQVLSASYFVGGALALPTLSVSMEPADYLKVHNDSWATGRGSERAGFLEIFEADGTVAHATGFGLRLHGGAGRDGDINTKKSYKAYFRKEYGDGRLVYPLIPDTSVYSFDKLVLRAGFNDAFRTGGGAAYLRDEVVRELRGDMGALYAHGSWFNLFVNMRYRGVFNVTEKMEEKFMESYTGEEGWDVMKTGNEVQTGDNVEWESLHTFMVQGDFSQEAMYREAEKRIDIENFTGYMILNTWAQNHDWPHNNWYAARRRVPEARWIFLCWDAEFGLGLIPGGYTTDTFEFALNQSSYLRDIFAGLLKSPIYQAYFMEQVDRHLFYALKPANVLARIGRIQTEIAPDMTEEAALTGNTQSQWLANVGIVRTFASNRGTYYRNFLQNSARFRFPLPPRVFSSDSSRVVNTGRAVVRLRGTRFRSDTAFTFDGLPPAATKLISSAVESVMDVTLPLDLSLDGLPVIVARNPVTGESSHAEGLFEVTPPIPLPRTIDPPAGDLRGGDRVVISGDSLVAGARVTFGGAQAPSVTLNGESLEVITPAGAGEVEVAVTNVVQGVELPGTATLRFTFVTAATRFIRGDSNGDGSIDISDPIQLLVRLFGGGAGGPCLSAADFDDSGTLELTDVLGALSFLFLNGLAPAAPYPACGLDGTLDEIPCLGRPASCR